LQELKNFPQEYQPEIQKLFLNSEAKLEIIEELKRKTEELLDQEEEIEVLPKMNSFEVEETPLVFDLKKKPISEKRVLRQTGKMQKKLEKLVQNIKKLEENLNEVLQKKGRKLDYGNSQKIPTLKVEEASLGNIGENVENVEYCDNLNPIFKTKTSSRTNPYKIESFTSLFTPLSSRRENPLTDSKIEQHKSNSNSYST
jgi:hypothetical protein